MTPPTVFGPGAATLAKITAAGAEFINVAGNAGLQKVTSSGAGTVGPPKVSAATIKPITAAGAGAFRVSGAAAVVLKPINAYGEIPHLVTADELITEITSQGGFHLAGQPGINYEFVGPPITQEFQSVGGFVFGGQGQADLIDPTWRDFEVKSSGGFVFGGQGVVDSIDASSLITEIVSQGGFVFSGVLWSQVELVPPDITEPTKYLSRGGFVMGGRPGPDPVEFISPDIYDYAPDKSQTDRGEFQFGGCGLVEFLTPDVVLITSSGGFYLGGAGVVDDGDEYNETWALNGFNLEPSLYTNFFFNSFAMFQEQAYGTRDDGIYLLEGPDDAGQPIIPGLRLEHLNFATEKKKRLRFIRPGETGAPMVARVSAGENEEICEQEGNRIPVSRMVEGKEFTLDLQGFKELGYLEILPLILFKR